MKRRSERHQMFKIRRSVGTVINKRKVALLGNAGEQIKILDHVGKNY